MFVYAFQWNWLHWFTWKWGRSELYACWDNLWIFNGSVLEICKEDTICTTVSFKCILIAKNEFQTFPIFTLLLTLLLTNNIHLLLSFLTYFILIYRYRGIILSSKLCEQLNHEPAIARHKPKKKNWSRLKFYFSWRNKISILVQKRNFTKPTDVDLSILL